MRTCGGTYAVQDREFFQSISFGRLGRIDAIFTVTATGGDGVAVTGNRRAIAFIIDRSGSMQEERKMDAAKHAARVCIDLLDEKAEFCVVAFNHEPHVLVPLAPATRENKDKAHRRVQGLTADGGTAFSTALIAARDELMKLGGGIRYALFLTDGENDPGDAEHLHSAVDKCKGVFVCDGRGVGAHWTKADLTFIANTLLGNADIIPAANRMEAAFKEAITAALAKGVADVCLRLWTPKTVKIASVKQVSPEIVDLAGLTVRKDDKTAEVPIGGWAEELRLSHHLDLRAGRRRGRNTGVPPIRGVSGRRPGNRGSGHPPGGRGMDFRCNARHAHQSTGCPLHRPAGTFGFNP